MMTIEEIRTGKEGQTFDLKSILIDPKALAIPNCCASPSISVFHPFLSSAATWIA